MPNEIDVPPAAHQAAVVKMEPSVVADDLTPGARSGDWPAAGQSQALHVSAYRSRFPESTSRDWDPPLSLDSVQTTSSNLSVHYSSLHSPLAPSGLSPGHSHPTSSSQTPRADPYLSNSFRAEYRFPTLVNPCNHNPCISSGRSSEGAAHNMVQKVETDPRARL